MDNPVENQEKLPVCTGTSSRFFFNVKKALCKQGREKESSLKQLETTLYLYLFIFVFVFQLSCVIK
jgi:hypothetical protein